MTSDSTVFTRLGIRPVINGVGTVTSLGGSLMAPEVVHAMNAAAGHFVPLTDLQEKAGEHLARLLHVPAAAVTCGAASAITAATAAAMVRGERDALPRLPDTAGLPFEVILQKSHHDGYEPQMRVCGAKLVTVETLAELEAAIHGRTAMLFFLNRAEPDGKISRADWVRIGKERGVPTFNDAAADLPPKERLWQYVDEGFDMVGFSGGKGLRGPQSTGLLVGQKRYIDAAREALSPYAGIGRGMKVSKEEIVGLVAAVERFLRVDHDAEFQALDRRVAEMQEILRASDGVVVRRHVPAIANPVPHLTLDWDEAVRKPEALQVVRQLERGDPPIHIQYLGPGHLMVSVWMLRGSEHRLVARRLADLLAG